MTIEQKRRELFEKWDQLKFGCGDEDYYLDENGDYFDTNINQCWMAFNAALDAVTIELPSRREFTQPKEDSQYWEDAGFNNARALIRASIESTRLGLKVLP